MVTHAFSGGSRNGQVAVKAARGWMQTHCYDGSTLVYFAEKGNLDLKAVVEGHNVDKTGISMDEI